MKKYLLSIITAFLIFSVLLVTAQPGLKNSMERGKTVYQFTCLNCHQEDGLGTPRMNPPLANTKWVLGDKKALCRIVLFGLKGGVIEIDGDHFYNPMPPQAHLLSDQQVADVLTYVRNSFGNKAGAVMPADVKAARGNVKKNPARPVKKTVKQ